MLSTRSMCNADIDYYRRPERGVQMTLGQASSISEHCAPSTHSSRRQSPANDFEQKSAVSQRKRVPVACERCRKRKIKCSGDEGGGQGCLNCRNAGWDGCQFLRVHSFTTHVVNPAATSNGRSWPCSTRFHPYSHSGYRNLGHSQDQTSYSQTMPQYPMWSTNVDYASSPASTQPPIWTRSSYPAQYSQSYDSEPADAYVNPAPPSYMLPDPEPAPHLSMSYMQAFNRPQQNTVWIDHMESMPMVPNHGQMTLPYAIGVTEGPSTFASVNMPTSVISTSERLFPTAASLRYLPSVSMATSDTPPMSATSHRSSVGWQTETASNSSVTSSHTSCSERHDGANSFADPTDVQHSLSYRYGDPSTITQSIGSTTTTESEDPQTQSSPQELDGSPISYMRYRNNYGDKTRNVCSGRVINSYADGISGYRGRNNMASFAQRTAVNVPDTLKPTGYPTKNVTNEVCHQGAMDSSSHIEQNPSS